MVSTTKLSEGIRQSLDYRLLVKTAGLFFALIFTAGLLSVHLGQDANWDLQNYHIYNAFALFHHRHNLDIGATAQWYFNPAPDLPYYALIQSFSHHPKIVAFIQGCHAGILWFLLWLLFEQTRRYVRIKAWVARLAWVTACSGSALVSEIGTTFNDIPQTYLTIAGLYFFSKHLASNSNRRNLYISFLIFGLGVGIKLTSAVFIVAAVVALLLVNRSIREVVLATLFGTLGVLLTGGWWFLYLATRYQNPFFPYFNNVFHSPWWSLSAMTDDRFFPRSVLQWFGYPIYWLIPNKGLVTEVYFADGRVLIGLISTIGCLIYLAIRRRLRFTPGQHFYMRKHVCAMAIFFLVSYVLWLHMFSIYRYAMPLETLSPLMLMILLSTFKERLSTLYFKKTLVGLFAALLVVIMLTTKYPNWMRAQYSREVLSAQTSLDAKGATIVASAGDPPLSYIFALIPGAAHFITIAGSDVMGSRLFEQARSVIASSDKIYVLYQEGKNPQVITDVQHYWGLMRSSEPCIPIKTNIGASVMACRLQHDTSFPTN